MTRPIVAVTVGDLRGIGPAVVARSLKDPRVRRACSSLVFQESSSFRSLSLAVEAVLQGKAQALVTGPISKSSWRKEGVSYLDHTDYLSQWGGKEGVGMMLLGKKLRLALVTRHLPLAQVPSRLKEKEVVRVGKLFSDSLKRLSRFSHPRMLLCGLNPHAGEGGILGGEERRVLVPAVQKLKRSGVRIEGPLACDAAIRRHAQGGCDGVLALYHDQALIPLKLLDGYSAVQWTMGLSFIRTSPVHGTAFDIAGKADPSGMVHAILLAAKLSRGGPVPLKAPVRV